MAKMEKLDKEKALLECYRLWNELAQTGAWNKPDTIYEFNCPCCQYVIDHTNKMMITDSFGAERNCDMCPLLPIWGKQPKVGDNEGLCEYGKGSVYDKWKAGKSKTSRKKWAGVIANFCKEALYNLYGTDATMS
jgi:hypothetical protein